MMNYETLGIVIASLSLGYLVPMFWKRVIGTTYLTEHELKKRVCASCNTNMGIMKAEILTATTEDRRHEMKAIKADMNDKLSKIMAVLLIIALKKEGESLTDAERNRIINLIAGHGDKGE